MLVSPRPCKPFDETCAGVAIYRLAGIFVCAYLIAQTLGGRTVPLPSSLTQPVFLVILGIGSAPQGADSGPALQIAGKAASSIAPTAFYAFTPTVTQRAERPLKFTIQNKPSWASFGLRRGTLYGTPHTAQAGTYQNILITVSDGIRSVTLPPFSITVAAPAAAAAK